MNPYFYSSYTRKMIHVIAIDDEPLALEVLLHHAAKVDFIILEHTFTNCADGIAYVLEHKPDALFLDINMPDQSGLDIAPALPAGTQVVFTTAYSEHAATGFELDATDYLLKPIPFARFEQACYKIVHRRTTYGARYILVKEQGMWNKVMLSDVLYVEARGNYMQLVTFTGTHLLRRTVHEMINELPSWFCRTHKSYIVNMDRVSAVSAEHVVTGGHVVPLSAGYRADVYGRAGIEA